MTKHPTKPGQRCRVIGSRSKDNGEGNGPNMGKVVTTKFLHQMQAADRVPVWRCTGDNLVSYHGGVGEVDFLNYWLEVIEDPPTPVVDAKKKAVEA